MQPVSSSVGQRAFSVGAHAVNLAAVAENKKGQFSPEQSSNAAEALLRREHAAFGHLGDDRSAEGVIKYTTAYLKYLDGQVDDINQYTRYRGTDVTAKQLLSEAQRMQAHDGPVADEARDRLRLAAGAFVETFHHLTPVPILAGNGAGSTPGAGAKGMSSSSGDGQVTISADALTAAEEGVELAHKTANFIDSFYRSHN